MVFLLVRVPSAAEIVVPVLKVSLRRCHDPVFVWNGEGSGLLAGGGLELIFLNHFPQQEEV